MPSLFFLKKTKNIFDKAPGEYESTKKSYIIKCAYVLVLHTYDAESTQMVEYFLDVLLIHGRPHMRAISRQVMYNPTRSLS